MTHDKIMSVSKRDKIAVHQYQLNRKFEEKFFIGVSGKNGYFQLWFHRKWLLIGSIPGNFKFFIFKLKLQLMIARVNFFYHFPSKMIIQEEISNFHGIQPIFISFWDAYNCKWLSCYSPVCIFKWKIVKWRWQFSCSC